MIYIFNAADLRDPACRRVNAEKTHTIPIGSLVELDTGARLFVVHHGRGRDQTPLYWLCHDKDSTEQDRAGWKNRDWIGGYPEDSLKVIG